MSKHCHSRHTSPRSRGSIQPTLISTALMMALCTPALAAAQETMEKDVSQLDAIAVTGSRIKRAEMEGPAPVTVISSEQIRAEGFVNVYDALKSLTEVTGSVLAEVNGGTATNASPLNLRNLGPGRTLLLVDGRRVADYPLPYQGQGNFANFNNIPMAMVERIEVLSSGGSAIYGSDAMAGVINIIMKKNVNGDEVRARGGTTWNGGGHSYELSWAGGRSGNRWNATYGLQYTRKKPLFAGDRPFIDSNMKPAAAVKPLLNDPWPWDYGIELVDMDNRTRITPPNGACARFEDMHEHQYVGNQHNPPEFPGISCMQDRDVALWSLRNGANNLSGFGNFSMELANGMEFWTSATIWDGEGEARQSGAPKFELLRNNPFIDADSGQTLRARRTLTTVEAGGRSPFLYYTNERSWDLATGFRGTLGERFDWDATIGRTEYKVGFSFPAVMQAAIDQYYLGPQLGVDANGFPIHRLDRERFWNPMDTATFQQLTTHGHSSARSWMNQAQFVITGDVFDLPAGPVGFAAVLEAGSQGYRLNPDPNTFGSNWQYDQPGGSNQGGGSRKRYATGAEFKLPLLASLDLTAAARFDRYDDDSRKENNTTWNIGLEWRPLQSLLVRGAYNTTFRAPDMHYLFATGGVGSQDHYDFSTCVLQNMHPNCAGEQLYLRTDFTRTGNMELESETGKSWSVGFVWDALDNFSISADYWHMTIDNQVRDFDIRDILELENQCRNGIASRPSERPMGITPGSADCAGILARVTRSAPGTNRLGVTDTFYPIGQIVSINTGPVNLAWQEVAGVDTTVRYRFPTANWGDFNFQFGYTNQLKNNDIRAPGSPVQKRRDWEGEYRTQARASINWMYGAWNTTVFARRIGHVPGDRYDECPPTLQGVSNEECRAAGISVGRLKAPIYTNLNVGYQINQASRVNLYVDNLFNEYTYKDPWKMYFLYANERIFSRVGREVTVEFVHSF